MKKRKLEQKLKSFQISFQVDSYRRKFKRMIKFWNILESKGEKSKETFEDTAKVRKKYMWCAKKSPLEISNVIS